MPRDLLAGITPEPRPPRDLFAADSPVAPAQPPDMQSQILAAVGRSNPVAGGIMAGFNVLPSWLKDSLSRDAGRISGSLADAITLPMDTLTNKDNINAPQVGPNGQVQPQNDVTMERAANAAGWMQGGEMPGGRPRVTTAEGGVVPQKLLDAIMRDKASPANVAQRVGDISPAAVVADVGDNTQKMAAAVATQPGGSGAQVSDFMKGRAKDSMTRVPQAVNDVLGPATPPSEIAAGIAENKKVVGPQYDPALDNAPPVDPTPVAASIDALIATKKGPAQAALRQVRDMLNVNGANATDQMARLDTTARGLFETRNAIDGMISPTGDTKVNGALKDVRKQIDELLAQAVPDIKNIDAQYRELSRQGDALDTGANVLDAGKSAVWPQENATAVAAGVQPEGALVGPSAATFRLTQAARGDIERIVGTKKNDRVALANIIQGESDWNPQKLAQLFGQDKADAIMKVVDGERRLAETENLAVNGSKTAAVTAAQQALNGTPVNPSAVQGRTMLDAIFQIADKVTAGASAARREATAKAIADAVLSKGNWSVAPRPASHLPMPLEAVQASGTARSRDARQQIIDSIQAGKR